MFAFIWTPIQASEYCKASKAAASAGLDEDGPYRSTRSRASVDLRRARSAQKQLGWKPCRRKRTAKEPVHLGGVYPHYNGFRVQAWVNGHLRKGPTRSTRARANADLRRAQSAQTHEEYACILERIRHEANLPAHANVSSGDARRASGGREPCQNRSDRMGAAASDAAIADGGGSSPQEVGSAPGEGKNIQPSVGVHPRGRGIL